MNLKNVLRNNGKSFQVGSILIVVGLLTLLVQKAVVVIKKVPSPSPTPNAEITKVTKVIDGDSIVISSGEEVRYIGVNTPEIQNDECFATEASEFNKNLVLGKDVKLIKDTSETDKYGRLLRYVYIGDELINDRLVKEGFASVMTVFPDVKLESTFVISENFAKINRLGLWGKCRE